MSSTLLGEVWEMELPTTEKLALAYLADGADHTGRTPAQTTAHLAQICDRAAKTMRTALKDLSDSGHLDRSADPWVINPYPNATRLVAESIDDAIEKSDPRKADKPPAPRPDDVVDIELAAEAIDKTLTAPRPPPQELPTGDLPTIRLAAFCEAWGLTSPSDNLIHAWGELEKTEAKHNNSTKHHDQESGKRWVVTNESMGAMLPAILHAVAVFQARAEEGLLNHADGPAAFIDRELWLAPEYQVALADATVAPVEIIEADIDAMVQKLNRAGGPHQTHLRVSSRNPHTDEIETETLEVYANRVQGKYDQFEATREAFSE